jgi:hypothetical protein
MNATFELLEDETGDLNLRRAGEDDVAKVRIRRAFPWSKPDEFISIRNSEGKELMLLETLSGLSPELRQTIEQRLADTIFIPTITRVDKIDVTFGFQQWHVQTDRGLAEFRVQEREDIRFLPDGRYSIRDADGNIYAMRPRHEMDEHSRRALGPLI